MTQNDFKNVLNLSPRELEVFTMLGAGIGTKSIARELDLSTKTIETHAAHLKTKLKQDTTWALRAYATRFAVFCETTKVKLVDAPVPSAPKLQFQPA